LDRITGFKGFKGLGVGLSWGLTMDRMAGFKG
jgi:hypothetical protein